LSQGTPHRTRVHLVFFNTPLGHPDRFLAGAACLLREGAPEGTPALGLHSRSARIRTVHLTKSNRALQHPGAKTGHYTKPEGPVNAQLVFLLVGFRRYVCGRNRGCLAALAASVHWIVYIGRGRPSSPIFP
jgi:hypothetical protein